jgi:hypothetical protein
MWHLRGKCTLGRKSDEERSSLSKRSTGWACRGEDDYGKGGLKRVWQHQPVPIVVVITL